ncbi:MAG: hypothetical protein ACI4SF_14530 [Oscillospiraceae bacterium]
MLTRRMIPEANMGRITIRNIPTNCDLIVNFIGFSAAFALMTINSFHNNIIQITDKLTVI